MRGAVADVTIKNGEGRAILSLAKKGQRLLDPVDVIASPTRFPSSTPY
jgi:hypothetical protein